MSELRVFLGGEGPNDLGRRVQDRDGTIRGELGVVEALLRRCRANDWAVNGSIEWKQLTKLRGHGHTPRGDGPNVLRLVYEAKRIEADAVAFVRDADDNSDRPKVIEAAIEKARSLYPEVEVIGGVAVPVLEAWLLALLGEHQTETLGKTAAQSKLVNRGIPKKDTKAMVAVVTDNKRDRIPEDAMGLLAWLARADEVLSRGMAAATES